MPPSYRTIAAPAEDEFIEKKSRFIGYIAPVTTEQEAAAFIESVRARHREARHNCYAYRLRQNNLARFSDDGEPSGTAGRPILEVLQREDLTDVCVVVTRYFGGILLGTGGLARAYTQGCKIAVAAAGVLCMYPAVECTLSADYGFYGKLQNLLPQYGAVLLDTAFEGEVTVRFMLRQEALSPFSKALEELSAGSLAPTVQSESYYPFPNPKQKPGSGPQAAALRAGKRTEGPLRRLRRRACGPSHPPSAHHKIHTKEVPHGIYPSWPHRPFRQPHLVRRPAHPAHPGERIHRHPPHRV